MPLTHAHSYLVHPAKGDDPQPPISGTTVPATGALHRMLTELFDRAPDECTIQIVFSPDENGDQNNPCRDNIEAYARRPRVDLGRTVAQRLQAITTHRSGLGLLFLLRGSHGSARESLVISRFPADEGVVAQEDAGNLSVEFIERVFMKNSKAYKSVHFRAANLQAGFMEGTAVDKQLSGPRDLSDYWITDFLLAELRTTGPAGTRRLAAALMNAVKSATSSELKQELVSAARLMRGQGGATRSARAIIRRLGLSDEASVAIERSFPRRDLITEAFRFDRAEFERHVTYRTVELDNGALLMAEDNRFSEVFEIERLAAEDRMRYSTEGAIVDQRFRKTKR